MCPEKVAEEIPNVSVTFSPVVARDQS